MAATTGTLQLTANLQQVVSAGLVQPYPATAGLAPVMKLTNGTRAYQFDLLYARQIALAASTPQTLDLTALTDLSGATVALARVRALVALVADTAAGHTVTLGANGTNPWAAAWGAAGTQVLYPGGNSPYLFTDLASTGAGVGAVVTSTSKLVKIDPGSNAVTLNLIILGSSVA